MLILYNEEKKSTQTIPLYEYCNAARNKQAANYFHLVIRKKLKTNDTFYISIVDESESKIKYFKCWMKKIDGDNEVKMKDGTIKKYTYSSKSDRITIKEILREFEQNDKGVFRELNDDIENLINNNKLKLNQLVS